MQLRLRRLPGCQPHAQLIEVEGRQHGIAMQQRRSVDRFGRGQLRQFAALHAIEADRLQRLQGRTQDVLLRALHATRDQADTAMLGAQDLDEQAGLAPGPRMQHERRLADEAHQNLPRIRRERRHAARGG